MDPGARVLALSSTAQAHNRELDLQAEQAALGPAPICNASTEAALLPHLMDPGDLFFKESININEVHCHGT